MIVTKADFLSDLRSGFFGQAIGVLHIEDDGYCCLGVYCHRASGSWKRREDGQGIGGRHPLISEFAGGAKALRTDQSMAAFAQTLDISINAPNWRWVVDQLTGVLMGMNDSQKSFFQIADWIEKESPGWIRARSWKSARND